MKRLFLFILLAAMPTGSWAGALDLGYVSPSPTKALAYSLVIPGSGHFYLARHDPYSNYGSKGFLYLVLSAGLAIFTLDKMQKGEKSVALGGAACFGLFRMMEFGDVADDAERSRARVGRQSHEDL